MKITLLTMTALVLIACNQQEVSFETLETQRQTAIDNSTFNAQTYRAAYAPSLKIKSRGDSSIKDGCPTGDGWATIDLLSAETGAKIQELKCSTVSATIGCMLTTDFNTRYTDGKCDSSIPFPLPKAVK